MKKRWLTLGSVALLAGCACWLWLDDEVAAVPGDAAPGETVRTPEAQVQEAFAQAADAGTEAIQGTVVDDEGHPVAGAEVALYLADTMPDALSAPNCEALLGCMEPAAIRTVIERLEAGTLMPKPWATTVSEADGRFSFPAAPAVDSQLIARKGGLAGNDVAVDGVELSISPASEQTAILKLLDESPFASAQVWVVSSAFLEATTAVSDANGVIHTSLHSDEVWVLAAPPGFLPEVGTPSDELIFMPPRQLLVKTRIGGEPVDAIVSVDEREFKTSHGEVRIEELRPQIVTLTAHTPELSSRLETVDLSDPDMVEAVIELRAGARVLLTLVDQEGQPVKSASASLENSETSASASADEEGGLLVLGPVPEGEFVLTVVSDDFREVTRTVDLTPGDHALEIALSRAATLDGTIVDGEGKPVVHADIEYSPAGGPTQVTRSDERGYFIFRGSPVADAVLVASKEDTGFGEARVTMPQTVTLQLKPKAVLVLDVRSSDGTPLEDARGFLEGAHRMGFGLDEHGHGRVAGLRGGRWKLEVTAQDHPGVFKNLELTEGRELHESIVMPDGVSVSGRVVDEDGKPVFEATLFTPNARESTSPDAQGNFKFTGLAPGKTELLCVAEGYDRLTQRVTAPAQEVLFRLKQPAIVTGRVVDEAGRAVRRFEVNDLAVDDSEGRFSVPAANGALDVWSEGFGSEVRLDAVGDVGTITLHPLQKVEGEVVDAQGSPLAGVAVRVVPSEAAEVYTLANGRFSLVTSRADGATIVASRGAFFATSPWSGRFVRLQLGRGTRVIGRVVAQGRVLAGADVAIEGASPPLDGRRSLVTDAQGAFEIDLPPGLWKFSAVGIRLARTVEISGERSNVELRDEAGRCTLEVRAELDIVGVVLEPAGPVSDDEVYRAGTIHLSGQPQGLPYAGLPCGAYRISVFTPMGTARGDLLLEARTVYVATPPVEDEPAQQPD